jgi:arsenate reductase-like glutaredoxin family protein
MIDKIYTNSAKRIREEFIKLHKPLDFYLYQLQQMNGILEATIVDLEKFNKTLNKKSKESAEKELHDRLLSTEEQQEKIYKALEPINKQLEKLSKEEDVLWKQIKMTYPDISEEDLIKEIQKSL